MPLDSVLEQRLGTISNLPSPPRVALRIIELARDPEPDVKAAADAICVDPALTAKILRMANSPLYGQRRTCDNLRQALIVLGLNATLSLALSFSLSVTVRGSGSGLDYERCWRRALLGGLVARTLAKAVGQMDQESFFLAGLLQDIGVLAIDKAFPDTYRDLASDAGHDVLASTELERLGADHAQVGAWLVRQWNLPGFLADAIEASHCPDVLADDSYLLPLVRCLRLSGAIADIWLTERGAEGALQVASLAEVSLGLDSARFAALLTEVREAMPDTEALFETSLLAGGSAQEILDQAKEILLVRNLAALQEMSSLRATAETLETRTAQLEEANRRDPLTGAFCRGYLDAQLEREFAMANQREWPLSVLFVDIDHFKSVNDEHGHAAGDRVLCSLVSVLTNSLRPSDVLARFGGEEFVVLLPGAAAPQAGIVAQRLVDAARAAVHEVGDGLQLQVTISVGAATHAPGAAMADAIELLSSADAAVYQAKRAGRDNYRAHAA